MGRWNGFDSTSHTDVHLDVPRRELAIAALEAALLLPMASLGRPEAGGRWGWLGGVERRLHGLHVRRHQGGDALEAVGRERAAESEAPVDAHAC